MLYTSMEDGLGTDFGKGPKEAVRTPHVLVVEDDSAIRDALAEALSGEGLIVETAADGRIALELMEAGAPHLVLTDLMMPKMSGWQLIQQMNQHPRLREIPVIVLTAAGNAGSVPLGYPVFIKPLRIDPLVQSISRLLRRR
jgi:two-component system, chemotaxis family, chemotaxis protein CheY